MSQIQLQTHLWIDTTITADYPWSNSVFPFGYLVFSPGNYYSPEPDRVEYLLREDHFGNFTTYITNNFPEYLI